VFVAGAPTTRRSQRSPGPPSISHCLGLRIVAEGVETFEVLDVVTQLGCDVVQGYVLSRPVAPELVPATIADISATWRRLALAG
jgi:predicted signal transduction protein with EAL and GGDEF domain